MLIDLSGIDHLVLPLLAARLPRTASKLHAERLLLGIEESDGVFSKQLVVNKKVHAI